MKIFNIILALLFTTFLIACSNTDKSETTTKTTSDDKSKVENTSNTTTTNTENKTDDGLMLSSVGTIEAAATKGNVPNFSWEENGKQMSTADLKGNVIFVNLWATWCGPCIKEMPELSELSNELKDKNFKMIGLNVFHQDGTPDVKDFLTQKPVSYWVVDGNDELVNAFETSTGATIEGVPTTYIVDKEGKIVETIVGAQTKASFLAKINKYL